MLRNLLASTDWIAYKTGERSTRGTVAKLYTDDYRWVSGGQVRNWKYHEATDDMIEKD